MRRIAANTLAALHTAFMVALLAGIVAGPLLPVSAGVLFVAVPMAALRGRCWVTDLERRLRGRRVPSMTRRLVWWLTLGRARLTARQQWWVLGGAAAVWLARVAARLLGVA